MNIALSSLLIAVGTVASLAFFIIAFLFYREVSRELGNLPEDTPQAIPGKLEDY